MLVPAIAVLSGYSPVEMEALVWCREGHEGPPVPLWPCGWAGGILGGCLHPKTLLPRASHSGRAVKIRQTTFFVLEGADLGLYPLTTSAQPNGPGAAALAGIWAPLMAARLLGMNHMAH